MKVKSAAVVTLPVTLSTAARASQEPRRPAIRPQQAWQNIGECLYRSTETGIIYALIKVAGKQVRRSLETTEIGTARLRRDDLRRELTGQCLEQPVAVLAPQPIVAQKPAAPEPNPMAVMSFSEVGALWLATQHDLAESTKELRRYSIRTVARIIGDRSLKEITRLDCEKWAAEQADIHSRTFNLHLESLKMVLGYAMLHKVILENPADHLQRKVVRYAERVIPTKQQFAAILAMMRTKKSSGAPPADDAANLLEAISWLGLRQGEANALRWNDVDFEKKKIRVTGTKTKYSSRIIPLFPAVEPLLTRMHAEQQPKPTDPVFLVESAKRPLETACRMLGIPPLNGHYSLRHLAASQWLECGCSIKSVSQYLGHSPLDGGALALRTYLHIRSDFAAEEAAKVK